MTSLRRPESCLVTTALLALTAACLLLAAVAGAGAAVRLGVLTGPELDLRLGTTRIVSVTNQFPDCNPRLEGCQADFLHLRPGLPRYYTVWLIIHHQVPGPNGLQDQFGSQRLLEVQAGP